jgi:hypothetical protein
MASMQPLRRRAGQLSAAVALALVLASPAAAAEPGQLTVTDLEPQPPAGFDQAPHDVLVSPASTCAQPLSAAEANGTAPPCSPGAWPALDAPWSPILAVTAGKPLELRFAEPVLGVQRAVIVGQPAPVPNQLTTTHEVPGSYTDVVASGAATPTADPAVWRLEVPADFYVSTYAPAARLTVTATAPGGGPRSYALSVATNQWDSSDPLSSCNRFFGCRAASVVGPMSPPPAEPTPPPPAQAPSPPAKPAALRVARTASLRGRRMRLKLTAPASGTAKITVRWRGRVIGRARKALPAGSSTVAVTLKRRVQRANLTLTFAGRTTTARVRLRGR